MASNTKITRIETNTAQETVGFFNGARLIRIVSIIKEASINILGDKILIQSSGLPSFEFDVFSIVDIDGTSYTELSPSSGTGGEAYQTRLAEILEKLYTIFKGCCSSDSPSGGQGSIQWQDEGANVGTAGQYTTINITGNATATQTSPSEIEINVTSSATGQADIQFEDEGVALGTPGTVSTLDVVGQLHKATRVGNDVTYTAPSVGENLVLPSLDPVNALSAKIGSLIPNVVSWSSTGKQNNLSLTGWNDTWDGSTGTGKATTIVFTGSTYAILSGVSGGVDGRRMTIINATNTLVIIENQSSDSTSSNRFMLNDGMAIYLMPNQSWDFIYSSVMGAWVGQQGARFQSFDDFQSMVAGSVGNPHLFPNFVLGGVLPTNFASTFTSTQRGSVSFSLAVGQRAYGTNNINGAYLGAGGGATPIVVVAVHKVAMNSSPSGNKRIALGLGNYATGAGAYYTGNVLQSGWGFASDSGVANAATNWFLYSGPGGAANILANAIDSGIAVSSAVGGYNVFVTFHNIVTGETLFFHSSDMSRFTFAGTRTGIASNAGFAFWYEAYSAAAPIIYIDYLGTSSSVNNSH